MPVGGGKTEPHKKRSHKKRTIKSKAKQRIPAKNEPTTPIKNVLNSKQNNLNTLTPDNLSSLRWDDVLTDPTQEYNRIEQYKELRRQRYIDARQQAIQTLVEKMKITISNK